MSIFLTFGGWNGCNAQTVTNEPEAAAASWRDALIDTARPLLTRLRAWRAGVSVDASVRVPVAGRPPLHATLYRPASASDMPEKGYATVVVMLPYGRSRYGEAVRAGVAFARAGFAVLTVDLRGYEPGALARPVPWQGVQHDAAAVLDWIIAQPWSNQRVGTFGCSALGETQFALATARHPAHRAMLVAGAGGAAGALAGQHGYFGLFEGGVFQLASGLGWLSTYGWLQPPWVRPAPAHEQPPIERLASLPVRDLLPVTDNAWGFLMQTPLSDTHAWQTAGYVMDPASLTIPTLTIITLGDQTLSGALALHHAGVTARAAQTVATGFEGNPLIIAPGEHCSHEDVPPPAFTDEPGAMGELPADRAARWQALYNTWFRYWLYDETPFPEAASTRLPPVAFQSARQAQWQFSTTWPPERAQRVQWTLASTTGQPSLRAGAELIAAREAPQAPEAPDAPEAAEPPATLPATPASQWLADPANPVPSRGGPMCCTGELHLQGGRFDQAEVENRDDVLVFTSEPFDEPVRFSGPVHARLWFSSDAPDADLVVRVTRVDRDGRSINLQEGAQRVSLRAGVGQPAFLEPGDIVPVDVYARDLLEHFEAGERLRLHVAASAFPRLVRNLQTTENPLTGTVMRAARHRIHHDAEHVSTLTLHRLDSP